MIGTHTFGKYCPNIDIHVIQYGKVLIVVMNILKPYYLCCIAGGTTVSKAVEPPHGETRMIVSVDTSQMVGTI